MKKNFLAIMFVLGSMIITAGNNVQAKIDTKFKIENVELKSDVDRSFDYILTLNDNIEIVASCLKDAIDATNSIEEASEQDWSSEEWTRVFRNLFDFCNEFQ